MITTPQTLLNALQSRGLAPDTQTNAHGAEPDADAVHDRPWYIGLLLGVSGWLAGLFLLGFVALLFQPNKPPEAAFAGAVLLAAAWGLFKADRDGAFVTQLALALSIAGQCLMLFAMNEHARSLGPIAASALLLQVVLALVMPNPLHRLLSTFFATIAWALTVRFALFGEPEFWHAERAVTASLGQSLGGWLLAWLPVGAGLLLLMRNEPGWMARGWQPVARPVLTGLIVGLALATVASQPFESFRWLGAGPAQQNWLAVWPMLSALAALGGIAAAFALRSRALMGACALAVLLHVSHFYYALGTSLLLKSLLMLAMGGSFVLASRWFAQGERA
ncbi:MAG: DUF4401 domain-containing protein [Pseudomonadota bacterium]